MDIHSRGQPYAQIIFLHFPGSGRAYFIDDIRIPGARQQRCTGPCRGTYNPWEGRIRTPAGPSAVIRLGTPLLRKISHAERIGNTRIGLAAKQIDQLSVGQLRQELLHCHLYRLPRLSAWLFPPARPLPQPGQRSRPPSFLCKEACPP